ncbi:MAG TPA: M15 family metallopeptidase, partial [Mycobacterium sp.]|nr:M15 family metallopeptidase [Mycobacterium sp.]
MVDPGSCTWTDIPGTSVRLQIQNGWPLTILRAFAADYNAYVEPLRDADSAAWTPTNSVASSNHLSGTAMDLNWNSHPFKIADAGFNQQQIGTMRELLAFYEGTVFWGNDWSSPKDAMHFQLASLTNGGNINTYNNPAVGDFIARKIRADGYSTFRRGG